MGRCPWSNRRTIEECFSLGIAFLSEQGYFDGCRSGSARWKNGAGEEVIDPGRDVDRLIV